jgi:hypothetical protein
MHQSTSRIRRGGFGRVEEVYSHAGSAEVSESVLERDGARLGENGQFGHF